MVQVRLTIVRFWNVIVTFVASLDGSGGVNVPATM